MIDGGAKNNVVYMQLHQHGVRSRRSGRLMEPAGVQLKGMTLLRMYKVEAFFQLMKFSAALLTHTASL